MNEYAATFDLIDSDDDGLISAEEFLRLMELLGQKVTPEVAEAAMAKIDSDGDGLVNLEELSAYLSSVS